MSHNSKNKASFEHRALWYFSNRRWYSEINCNARIPCYGSSPEPMFSKDPLWIGFCMHKQLYLMALCKKYAQTISTSVMTECKLIFFLQSACWKDIWSNDCTVKKINRLWCLMCSQTFNLTLHQQKLVLINTQITFGSKSYKMALQCSATRLYL